MMDTKKNKPKSEKELLKKFEGPKIKKDNNPKKDGYLNQSVKNYRDGDRN